MWGQYNIMDFHDVKLTGGLWCVYLQPHRFQGVQLYCFHSQTTTLFRRGEIIGSGGVMGRSYLGGFFLVVESGPTFSGYSWFQILTEPTQNHHQIYAFNVLRYFLK